MGRARIGHGSIINDSLAVETKQNTRDVWSRPPPSNVVPIGNNFKSAAGDEINLSDNCKFVRFLLLLLKYARWIVGLLLLRFGRCIALPFCLKMVKHLLLNYNNNMTAQCAHLVILVLVIAAAARRCNMHIKGFNILLIRRRPSVRPPACDKALPADHISRKKERKKERKKKE